LDLAAVSPLTDDSARSRAGAIFFFFFFSSSAAAGSSDDLRFINRSPPPVDSAAAPATAGEWCPESLKTERGDQGRSATRGPLHDKKAHGNTLLIRDRASPSIHTESPVWFVKDV